MTAGIASTGTALGIALALAGGAHAEDRRIRTLAYDPARIVTIAGRTGIQSTIAFAADERIENIALGDSATWQVTPNKRADLIFLKPITAAARTNMTVVTDRRTYLFELVGQRHGAAPVYELRFSYAEPILPPAPAASARPQPLLAVAAVPAPAPAPLDLHFAWDAHGAKALFPRRMFDDGHALYLAWPTEAALPAVLAVAADGSEGPVNYVQHGDYLVVDGVPPKLVLRAGRDMATLERRSEPAPAPHRTAER